MQVLILIICSEDGHKISKEHMNSVIVQAALCLVSVEAQDPEPKN